jgi:hypothetical protein
MKLFATLLSVLRGSLRGDKSPPLTRPSATLSPSDGERGAPGNPLATRIKTAFGVWIWNHTPTCAEMSRLTSRALEQPLTLKMRLKMRLHFMICAWCRRYFEQINFLHEHAPKLSVQSGTLLVRGLSSEGKNRIKAGVRKNLKLAL